MSDLISRQASIEALTRLKPCVWRIHGEKTMSLTIAGEYYYNESFMPCMGEKCPAFNKFNISCMKDGCNFDLKEET